ncbi:MAG TPA: GNAT family N-acetyltransferase [Roseiflexaceae bacterium]|nr:GNAT family N-acetyltransferase [Roseiflexaceae bacterium]
MTAASMFPTTTTMPPIRRAPAIQIQVVDSVEGLMGLEAEWGSLLRASLCATVFQTFEWQSAWLRAFGRHDPAIRPLVLAVREHGWLIGLAPLMVRNTGGLRTLTFLGAPYADYHGFLVDPAAAETALAAIWRFIAGTRGVWDAIDLDDIRPDSALLSYLRGPAFRTLLPDARIEPSSRCFLLDLHNSAKVQQILQKREYQVKLRRLGRQGKLELLHHSDPARVAERMPLYIEQHRAQWRDRPDGFARFDDPHVTPLFTATAQALSSRGWLLLSELTLDGRPVAFFYSFVFRGAYLVYRPCFDVQIGRYSPGSVLLYLLIEHLAARPFHTFDLMRGEHPYKLEYTTSTPHNGRLMLGSAL